MSKEQPQAAATAADPVDQLTDLKTGEYLVHVYIEETRGLKHPTQADSTVDPILTIKAFDKNRYSKVVKKVGSGATFWGEHYFFEKSFGTTYELENEKVTITVSDHNILGLDSHIGTVELNIPTIYNKPKHCIQYQWAALSGLTANFQEVQGFIKFSVGVFATGDEQIPLNEEKVTDAVAGPNKLDILYPPQIITKPYQIFIKIFRAENLKKMDDVFGKTDGYVVVQYGGLEERTETITSTLNPVWNEEIRLPCSLPTINNRITFKVYDYDAGTADELMGTNYFDIKDILEKKYVHPFWVNIYGAHSKAKAPMEKMQNDIPEIGTEWKGRYQISISMKEEEKPKKAKGKLVDPTSIKSSETIKREKHELRAEIHYAINLRKNDEEFYVKVRWGPNETATKKYKAKNRMIEFYESLLLPCEFPYGTNEDTEIPDVFVYVCNSEKDLSYIRVPWMKLIKPESKAKATTFKVNSAITTTREDLSGIVKMRMFICKPNARGNMSLYGWDRPVQKPQAKGSWKVFCNIFQAKDLLAGDSTGASDPWVTVYYYGAEAKTNYMIQTINPIWNQRLEFNANFDQVEDAPPLVLTLMDWDNGGDHDFLGSAIVNIDKENLNPTDLPKPQWVDVRYGKDGGTFGKVLLSICCYNRTDLLAKIPNSIEPRTTKYFLNMKILGLRNLESAGILPVKRAFVRFDVDSLKSMSNKSDLLEQKYVKTEPLNPGRNPNILTVINLELDLPQDPDYCPSLTAAVFDYIFKGVSQPLIGNFSIPLGDFIISTRAEIKRRIEVLMKLYEASMKAEAEKKSKEAAAKLKADENARNLEEETKDEKTEMSALEILPSEDKPEAKRPLLGKYQEPFTEYFENIKITKGLLPGENDAIKLDVFPGDSRRSSTASEDLNVDLSEESKASENFVIVSKYDRDGLEVGRPDLDTYMPLGYNTKDNKYKKHYRYFIDKEIEKSPFIDASPFVDIPIYRGKRTQEESFFQNLFGKKEDYRCVGNFKAMINIMDTNEKMSYDSKLAHVGKIAKTKGLEFSDEEFLRRKDVVVRLYVIEAEGLPDKDDDSNSDPYLIIKLGRNVKNERQHYQLDCSNPKFHKCFEFPATLPGASKLEITLMDWDRLDADDLIGTTTIDIEDRWYSSKWRSLKYVPIETRHLYHPSSKISQGSVKIWLEILPKDKPQPDIWHMAPKPAMDFELRAVVWECKDVPNVDFEDATDIYITGKLQDGQSYRTDTHFRSQNGKGSFNWRMVFPIKLPMRKHTVTFTIWDKDLLTANDFISEATFDFTPEAVKAFDKEEQVYVLRGPKGNDEKFWIPCTTTKMVDGRAVPENKGSILISLALVPKEQAVLAPVGQGRSNPNQKPYLPPPDGRFEWSWNVLKLYNQLIGPAMRRKILIYTIGGILIFLFLLSIPMLIAEIIGKNI